MVVLKRLAKQREEAIEMYLKAGNEAGNEMAAKERAELVLISRWLPQLAGRSP
jgi:uncharacterized protein YqeY